MVFSYGLHRNGFSKLIQMSIELRYVLRLSRRVFGQDRSIGMYDRFADHLCVIVRGLIARCCEIATAGLNRDEAERMPRLGSILAPLKWWLQYERPGAAIFNLKLSSTCSKSHLETRPGSAGMGKPLLYHGSARANSRKFPTRCPFVSSNKLRSKKAGFWTQTKISAWLCRSMGSVFARTCFIVVTL